MGNQNKTVFCRVEKNKNYSVINNEFLKRDDLSWKAKGILAYVLSLPNDWIINIDEVMNHATEGKAAFRSGWNELVEAGYIERNPIREKQRIKYWETIVKEKPGITAIPLLTDFQEVENKEVEKLANSSIDISVTTHDNIDMRSSQKGLEGHDNNGSCPPDKSVRDNITRINNTSINTNEQNALNDNFNKLWKLYPNKKGKSAAFKAYKKAIKDGSENKDIQDGIVAYSKYVQNNNTPKEYIKHGSTYFNNRTWEDDYTASIPSTNQPNSFEPQIYEHQVTDEDIAAYEKLKKEGFLNGKHR